MPGVAAASAVLFASALPLRWEQKAFLIMLTESGFRFNSGVFNE